jgi:hypothetical protein
MSFRQRAVIEFLAKEGNPKAGFIISTQRPNDKTWNGITPQHPKRSREQYPRPSSLWELSFAIVSDA